MRMLASYHSSAYEEKISESARCTSDSGIARLVQQLVEKISESTRSTSDFGIAGLVQQFEEKISKSTSGERTSQLRAR